MPNLSVLYLLNNTVTSKIKNYRKAVTAELPHLKFLDDRPIFVECRRHAEAWARGGYEEERVERKLIKTERDTEREKCHNDFKDMMIKAK